MCKSWFVQCVFLFVNPAINICIVTFSSRSNLAVLCFFILLLVLLDINFQMGMYVNWNLRVVNILYLQVLELGCGNSQLSEDLYKDGSTNITCIDLSAVAVEKKKKQLLSKGFDGMSMSIEIIYNLRYYGFIEVDIITVQSIV